MWIGHGPEGCGGGDQLGGSVSQLGRNDNCIPGRGHATAQSQKGGRKGMTLEGFKWISGQNTEKGEEELQRRMGAIS